MQSTLHVEAHSVPHAEQTYVDNDEDISDAVPEHVEKQLEQDILSPLYIILYHRSFYLINCIASILTASSAIHCTKVAATRHTCLRAHICT